MASGKHLSLRGFFILVLLSAALLSGVIFGAIYFSGVRYRIYHTEEHGVIRYIGKVDADDQPYSGRIYYSDSTSASITAYTENLTFQDGSLLSGNLFEISYSNGNVYVGQTLGVLRDGKGVLTFSGGDVYEGDFSYEDMTGSGSYYYKNGDVYVGQFRNGSKWGNGSYTWAAIDDKSDCYVGEFSDNKRNGEGVYSYADGTVYTGSYVEDAKSGEGVMVYANGDRYEGEFANDLRDGKGSYYFSNGDIYVGEFSKGAITGYGTYTFASGERPDYTGYFENGVIVTVEETPDTTAAATTEAETTSTEN
jgi:hypothetical protein